MNPPISLCVNVLLSENKSKGENIVEVCLESVSVLVVSSFKFPY